MARTARQIITVSPPNLDKTGFLSLENGLGGAGGPISRDWLLERFNDGFQVRMLRQPRKGFIEFAPGRASWWPIERADDSVVIQRLRVEDEASGGDAAVILLKEAEDWARFYGFAAVLVLSGHGVGPFAEAELQAHGYKVIDETADGVLLRAHILQGPAELPRLPRDWAARAANLGPGLVIQNTGHCQDNGARAEALLVRAREHGLPARIDTIPDAQRARTKLAAPGTLFCVVLDGQVIDTGHGTVEQIWQTARCLRRG